MTNLKIKRILGLYEKRLSRLVGLVKPAPHTRPPRNRAEVLAHALSMIHRMYAFLDKKGKRDKLMRWLGFLQGVLWKEGVYTLKQLRGHNK